MVQNSLIYCVYHNDRGFKMKTSLHAVVDVIFGKVYLITPIISLQGGNLRFSASNQNT